MFHKLDHTVLDAEWHSEKKLRAYIFTEKNSLQFYIPLQIQNTNQKKIYVARFFGQRS